jgi:hypothetical protein
VHFVNARWGIGFASFGLRALGGPIGAVPGLIGYCAATAGVRGCVETGAAYGLVGGLIAVDLLDALVLAHDKGRKQENRVRALRQCGADIDRYWRLPALA